MTTRALPAECPLEESAVNRRSRRSWARIMLGAITGSCAAVLYPILRYLPPPEGISVSAAEALAATVASWLLTVERRFVLEVDQRYWYAWLRESTVRCPLYVRIWVVLSSIALMQNRSGVLATTVAMT